jgi:hypothetical protein
VVVGVMVPDQTFDRVHVDVLELALAARSRNDTWMGNMVPCF